MININQSREFSYVQATKKQAKRQINGKKHEVKRNLSFQQNSKFKLKPDPYTFLIVIQNVFSVFNKIILRTQI